MPLQNLTIAVSVMLLKIAQSRLAIFQQAARCPLSQAVATRLGRRRSPLDRVARKVKNALKFRSSDEKFGLIRLDLFLSNR